MTHLNGNYREIGGSIEFNLTQTTTFARALAASLPNNFLKRPNDLLAEAKVKFTRY